MPLKLNLTVPNKAVHAFIGLVVVVALVVGVYAYTFPPTFLGHGADQTWIDTPAGEMTLQAAIDSGIFAVSVPFIPTCAGDEILKFNEVTEEWECGTDESLSLLECVADEYLKFDGTNWVCDSGGSPCTPSAACAAETCVGDTCTDSCGNPYPGTKTSGTCCTDTSWSPSPSTICSGVTFTQTSNCGRTRPAIGTQVCCVPNCSCATTLCPGSTCSDGCGGTCQGTRDCSSCQPTRCVPLNTGQICQGSVSGGNCCVSGYPVCVILNTGQICQGRVAGGYCCVQNCPVCNIFNVGICQGRVAGSYCCTF